MAQSDRDGAAVHWAAWSASMRRRRLSPGTIDKRRYELVSWSAWMGPGWTAATWRDVERWTDSRPLGPRAQASAVSHLRAFYQWARREGVATIDPCADVVTPKAASGPTPAGSPHRGAPGGRRRRRRPRGGMRAYGIWRTAMLRGGPAALGRRRPGRRPAVRVGQGRQGRHRADRPAAGRGAGRPGRGRRPRSITGADGQACTPGTGQPARRRPPARPRMRPAPRTSSATDAAHSTCCAAPAGSSWSATSCATRRSRRPRSTRTPKQAPWPPPWPTGSDSGPSLAVAKPAPLRELHDSRGL